VSVLMSATGMLMRHARVSEYKTASGASAPV